MAELKTDGPIGWTPAVEKSPNQKMLRLNVDRDIMGNVQRPFGSAKVELVSKLDDMANAISAAGDAVASVPKVQRQMEGLMDVAVGIRRAGKAVGLDHLADGIASVPARIATSKVDRALRQHVEAQLKLTRVRDGTRNAAEHFEKEVVRFGKWGGVKQMKEMTREPRTVPNRHERKRAGEA